jgi:hypothetical protein
MTSLIFDPGIPLICPMCGVRLRFIAGQTNVNGEPNQLYECHRHGTLVLAKNGVILAWRDGDAPPTSGRS